LTRIERFSIDGLAGRRRPVEFQLRGDLNVFWGLNGSGKTSLLRILHAALDNDAPSMARIPFRRAKVAFHSSRHDKVISRTLDKERLDSVSLVEDDEGRLIEYVQSGGEIGWQTLPRIEGMGRMAHRYLPITRLASRSTGVRRSPTSRSYEDERSFDEAFAEAISSLWIRISNSSLLAQAQVQRKGLADVLRLSVTGGASGSAASSSIGPEDAYLIVSRFLREQGSTERLGRRQFLHRYETDDAQRAIVDRIHGFHEEIDQAQEPINKLVSLLDDMFGGGKHIERTPRSLDVYTPDRQVIPLSGLSSGEKQLMFILLECMSGEDNTVMIDEPELSMHVDWQHRLIEAIRTVSPGTQLILATHSPEVMAMVPDSCIFEL
jgi:predicted ATPase